MADGPIRDFKGDDNGEWVVENGDFAAVAGSEAVPQGIRVRVGLFRGEAYLDEAAGVPYLEDDQGNPGILVKNPDPLFVRAVIGEAIADTPDVTNVVGAELIQEADRDASIAYQADTVYAVGFGGTVQVP